LQIDQSAARRLSFSSGSAAGDGPTTCASSESQEREHEVRHRNNSVVTAHDLHDQRQASCDDPRQRDLRQTPCADLSPVPTASDAPRSRGGDFSLRMATPCKPFAARGVGARGNGDALADWIRLPTAAWPSSRAAGGIVIVSSRAGPTRYRRRRPAFRDSGINPRSRWRRRLGWRWTTVYISRRRLVAALELHRLARRLRGARSRAALQRRADRRHHQRRYRITAIRVGRRAAERRDAALSRLGASLAMGRGFVAARTTRSTRSKLEGSGRLVAHGSRADETSASPQIEATTAPRRMPWSARRSLRTSSMQQPSRAAAPLPRPAKGGRTDGW